VEAARGLCRPEWQARRFSRSLGATTQKTQNCDETDMWRSSALMEIKGDMTVCKHPLARGEGGAVSVG
jgi:hypothetical protein